MERLRFAVSFFTVHSCVAIYMLKALLAPPLYDQCSPDSAKHLAAYVRLLIMAFTMHIAERSYQQSKTIMEFQTISPVSHAVEQMFKFITKLLTLSMNIAILALYSMDACKWLALTYICYLAMLIVSAGNVVLVNILVVPFESAKKKD